MKSNHFKKVLAIIFFLPIAIALLAYIFMLLWNWLMPAILGLKAITFWQAAGLLVLSKIIFSKWGFGYRNKLRWKMEEKFANMTAEEKECFKNEMKERCKKWSSNS